jgi:hypothetical protein
MEGVHVADEGLGDLGIRTVVQSLEDRHFGRLLRIERGRRLKTASRFQLWLWLGRRRSQGF